MTSRVARERGARARGGDGRLRRPVLVPAITRIGQLFIESDDRGNLVQPTGSCRPLATIMTMTVDEEEVDRGAHAT